MRIDSVIHLVEGKNIRKNPIWQKASDDVQKAVVATDWPHGSGAFTIYPQSGKKRGEGNGVKPIKIPCMDSLVNSGWKTEKYPKFDSDVLRPGDLDGLLETPIGHIGFEWETGNISSSHRAINKLLLAIHQQTLAGGFLVVPGSNLKQYLTDRIGNIDELRAYFPLWSSLYDLPGPVDIIVVEYDATSFDVPRIPKGTDGRAKR